MLNYCFIDIQGRFRPFSELHIFNINHSRNLNNHASRICEVSVEGLTLNRAHCISRPVISRLSPEFYFGFKLFSCSRFNVNNLI